MTRSLPLVGRWHELAALREALADGPGAVLVGEPGVGKSRLAAELGDEWTAGGRPVEHVLATAAAATIPFGALAALVPESARCGEDRLELMRLIARQLQDRHPEPPLLIIDDGHLLDESSAALLLWLAGADHARLLVTARTGAPCPDAVLALWKDRGLRRIELGVLEPGEVAELAAHQLGAPLDPRAEDWLLGCSGGNPLYLTELVAAAQASGSLALDHGRWRRHGPLDLGARLRELIQGRIGRLAPAERRALAMVALAEPIALEELSQLVDASVISALELRGLLTADPRSAPILLSSAHPLYGEVVRAGLGPVVVRELHRELSGVLDRNLPGRRMLLASWCLDDGRAPQPELLAAAAADALAAGDPGLALRFARAALATRRSVAGALLLGAALRATGAFTEAERLLSEFETEVMAGAQAPEYLFTRVADLHFGLGRSDEALALLARAAGWRADPGWAGEVQCLSATVCFTSGRLAEGVVIASALLEDADLSPRARLTVGWLLGIALPWLGRPAAGIAALRRARELAGGQVDPEWPETVALTNGEICAGQGWPEATARLQAARAQALSAHNERLAMDIEVGLMDLAMVTGDMPAGRRWAEQALARLSDSDPSGLEPFCLADLARSAALTGDLRTAQAALEAARDYADRRRLLPASEFRLGLARATVAGAEGRLDEARQLALEVVRGAVDAGDVLLQEAMALHLHLRLGGPAAIAAERLSVIAVRTEGVTLADQFARHAEASQRQDAAALVAVAEDFARIGAWLWAAEAFAQAATAFLADGRFSSATRARAQAAGLARRCGVSGDGLPLLVLDRMPGLSPREREVGGLVARGYTNAEIAVALVLSVRTVESHVYHATTKLGLRNRAEFGAWVQERTESVSADPVLRR